MRRAARLGLALALLAMTAAAAGCELQVGKADGDAEVDSAGVEAALAVELAAAGDAAPTSVSCPKRMLAREGERYECTAVHPRVGAQTVVVRMHDDGGFRWDVPADQ